MSANELIRLFHTARHLKPVQVYSRVLRPRQPRRAPPQVRQRAQTGEWQRSVPRPNAALGPNCFRFLNQERTVTSWNDPAVPKLWLYNLHYFESPERGLI